MKINELVKTDERIEQRTRIIPATYDEDGNLLTEETTETYEVTVPVMESVTREMTAEEEAEMLANPPEINAEPTAEERLAALEAAMLEVVLNG